MKKADYLHVAIKIAEHLENTAIQHIDYMIWLRYHRPLGYHLYDGCSGIALFFAALFHETGDRKYRNFALKIIQPLRKDFFLFISKRIELRNIS